MKRIVSLFVLVGFIAGAGLMASAEAKVPAAPGAKMVATVKVNDCVGCHKSQKVLPAGHVATKGLALKDCQGCHTGDGVPKLETKLPLWHLHALNGVTCAQCHGAGPKQAVEHYKCISCHDTKAVAEKTADLKPNNPHNSRHYGTEADCNLCHHQHKASVNKCAECHKFNFQVP